jgi:hypothetical protein
VRRDPRLALSVVELANHYRMAMLQAGVVEERPDERCRYMYPISVKYTGASFPSCGPDRTWFVIAMEPAAGPTLGSFHNPSATEQRSDRPHRLLLTRVNAALSPALGLLASSRQAGAAHSLRAFRSGVNGVPAAAVEPRENSNQGAPR